MKKITCNNDKKNIVIQFAPVHGVGLDLHYDALTEPFRQGTSLQPFGCIANHIISKGIERRYKDLYPHLSLLFLDFDAGTSDANIINRLHFLLQ